MRPPAVLFNPLGRVYRKTHLTDCVHHMRPGPVQVQNQGIPFGGYILTHSYRAQRFPHRLMVRLYRPPLRSVGQL